MEGSQCFIAYPVLKINLVYWNMCEQHGLRPWNYLVKGLYLHSGTWN